MRIPRLLPALAVCLTACGGADPAAREIRAPHWIAVPDLRIGSADGDDALTDLSDLEVGADGTIFTVHPMERRIRVFDPQGEQVRTIGRSGAGPGEFERPGRAGWRGDTLWVVDHDMQRISLFEADGRFLTTISPVLQAAADPADGLPSVAGLLADGTLHAIRTGPRDRVRIGIPDYARHVRLERGGALIDTLAELGLRRGGALVRDPRRPHGRAITLGQPFGDTDLVAITADGRALVRVDRSDPADGGTARFHVTKVALDGDTLFARAYPYAPEPVTPAQVDRKVAPVVEAMQDGLRPMAPSRDAAREWVRAALYLPEHHPPITALVAGRDGTLWLRREETRADVVTWTVLDRDGVALATVHLPRALRVLAADAEHVWGVEFDEVGVPYVARYRLSHGGEAP